MAKERGIGGGKGGGVKEQGTLAPASGKNTLAGGKQPSPGFNQSGTLTKGVIEGRDIPRSEGASVGTGHEGGLANTPYRGPGYDPERPLTALPEQD